MADQGNRPLFVTMGILFVFQIGAIALCRGPAPKPDSAAESEFSALRARTLHERILPATEPHPTGSVANRLVRERLVNALQELGLEVEVQSTTYSSPDFGEIVPLENVLARLPSEMNDLRPVLLVTHYDSCPFGPGASDAGACVAALLETARALRHHPALKRTVYFLFTDGEEKGLLGAQEFVKRHPLIASKPFVINIDARGCSGPSLMFETQNGNQNVIPLVAPALAWPRLANSLFVTVYRQLPNGTDFTVFNRASCPGINFACIDGAHVYHQPTDTLENVSLRTLQHHGEHALSIVRTVGSMSDEFSSTTANAVFFDVIGLIVVSYPESVCVTLQVVVLLILLAANFSRKRSTRRSGALLLASILILIWLVLSMLAGIAAGQVMIKLGLIERNLTSRIGWVVAIDWCVVLLLFWGICSLVFRRFSPETLWTAVWTGWASFGVMLAILLPGVSFVCLIPSCLAALLSVTRIPVAWLSVVAALGTGLLLQPMLHLFPIAMGATAGGITSAAFTLLLIPLCPMAGRTVTPANHPQS